ncbi:MAG: elongation factor P [Candidatus Omnitrophica bacterium]|nr:elongation factor P [Candidatus Omnitrophota bacterium]MCM8807425.1 elongation factor P [Candidatus Omnitrophota bacterium]
MNVLDLKEGNVFEYEGKLYIVRSATHVVQQQRRGIVKIKATEIDTGRGVEFNFRSDEDVKEVILEEIPLIYLYSDENSYYFMDNNTYEQFHISSQIIGEKKYYLRENLEVTGLFYQGKIIDIQLPFTVDLKVIEAEPGYKGDTVQGGKKKVKVETGLIVQTPLFIEVGDVIKIDTRTGEYITRV